MTKTLWLLSLVLCLAVIEPKAEANTSIIQTQLEVQQLEPGKSIEREISGGQQHFYKITLGAKQYLRVTADQKGIDLWLKLAAPDGKEVATINLIRPGGIESLSNEVETGGDYRVTVRAAGAATSGGAYSLRAETRAPNADEAKRIAAQALILRAKQLGQQGRAGAQQVIEASEQALSIWRELNDQQMIALSLTEIGAGYLRLGQQDKALEFAGKSLAAAREANDRSSEQFALVLLAAIPASLNQHDQAIQRSEQALRVARELKDRLYEAYLLGQIGYTYYILGKYEKAAEYYEQSLGMAREDKDGRGEGTALVRLAMVYMGLSRSEKAIEFLDPAVAIFRTLKDKHNEGWALSNLGAALQYLGRYDKATEIVEQGLALSREIKNGDLEGNFHLTLAGIHTSMGRYEKAIELNESALKLAREVKNRVLESRLLLQRSALFAVVNRNDRAIEYAEQALAISREAKYLNGEGDTLSVLGNTHARVNSFDKAIDYHEQALSVRRELKDREGISLSLNSMANAFVALGQSDRALPHYQQAIEIARDIKSPTREAGALAGLGDAYRRLGRFDEATELLAQALAINLKLGTRASAASNLYHLAVAERARGNVSQARAHVEESLKITESIRTELLSPDARASLLADGQDAYRLNIDLLMRGKGDEASAEDAALAFQLSERRRARSLLDLLVEARADVRQGVDASVLERERELARQLNARAAFQVQLLSRSHTPEQAAALKKEINQIEIDYERVQAEIRRASPSYAALTQPQPLSLEEIQQQLDPDTLLLEYSLGEERSHLWAITSDSMASYELPKEAQISQSARSISDLLTARSAGKRGETAMQRRERIANADASLPAAAAALSQTLLAPVTAQLGNKRLVIVADGALQYIPFAMLPEPERGRRGEGATGRRGETPLIVNHEIVNVPSASALAIQRKELTGRQPAPKVLAVIADPVFDRTDERFKPLLPEANTNQQSQPIALNDARSIEHLAEKFDEKSGATTHRLVIPRLPFTRQEATRLLALTPKNTSFGAVDFQANRASVLTGDLSQYRYVHFATHGVLDSERPGLSSLVLSLVDAQGKQQDGFLRANDIYNLKLPAELVVLSACQTGLGKEIKGEGLVGLTRGFMYAGAPRVVVSLWNVNDKATADLMTKFYERMLKQGERPAAALRAAQVEMWKQKQWQAPYYWAAFTLQGEWR